MKSIIFLLEKYYHVFWAGILAAGFFSGDVILSRFPFRAFYILPVTLLPAAILLIPVIIFKNNSLAGSLKTGTLIVILLAAPALFLSGFLNSCLNNLTSKSALLDLFSKMPEVQKGEVSLIVEGRTSSHLKGVPGRQPVSYDFFINTRSVAACLADGSRSTKTSVSEDIPVVLRILPGEKAALKRDDSVRCKGMVKSGKKGYYLAVSSKNIEIVENNSFTVSIFRLRSRIYECIRRTIYLNMPPGEASICEALLLGNGGNVPENIEEIFRKSGLYHMLSISGFHMSFFIVLISASLKLLLDPLIKKGKTLRMKEHKSGIVDAVSVCIFFMTVSILFFYNFILGEKASALRAAIMAFFVLSAENLKRIPDRKTFLSFAFIIMLAFYPGFYNDLGFWLSIISMAGLVYGGRVLTGSYYFLKKRLTVKQKNPGESQVNGRPGYFISILLAAFSVNIFLFPVLVHFFEEFSVVSFLSNLAAFPFFYLILILLFISSILALIWPPASVFFLKAASFLSGLILKIAGSLSSLPGAVIKVSDFGILQMIIYYIILLASLMLASALLERRIKKKMRI